MSVAYDFDWGPRWKPCVAGVHTRGLAGAGEQGIALIVALLAVVVLSALGLSLLVMTTTEILIASHYRDGVEAFHAADAALERAMPDLAAADWTTVLTSVDGVRSAAPATFGDATLTAVTGDGLTVDLARMTNLLNCPQVYPPATTPCTAAQMDSSAGERPWGTNNPRWRLYGHGRLSAVVGGVDSPVYVAVWIADDPAETDGDPSRDGSGVSNPGAGILQVRAAALGREGAHRAVEATLARAGAGLRIVSWRVVR